MRGFAHQYLALSELELCSALNPDNDDQAAPDVVVRLAVAIEGRRCGYLFDPEYAHGIPGG